MNTQIKVDVLSHIRHQELVNHLNQVHNIFLKVVNKFSRFRDDSELSLLNKSPNQWFYCSDELYQLIKFGIEAYQKTNGIFDISIIDILEKYGYGSTNNFENLDNPTLRDEIRHLTSSRPNLNSIELDETNKKVRLQPGQRMDLGGIAKGFAIRLAGDYLKNNDIKNFLINAGGDIWACGHNSQNKHWKIDLFDPITSIKTNLYTTYDQIELSDQALACSGGWARKIKFFHHLINPKTGLPSGIYDFEKYNIPPPPVFVISSDPVIADIVATAVYIDPQLKNKKLWDAEVLLQFDSV